MSYSVVVPLLESFRMSLAGERVSNHCLLDRMMFATTALINKRDFAIVGCSRFSKLFCRKC